MIPMQSQHCGLFSFQALPLPHATSACTATKNLIQLTLMLKLKFKSTWIVWRKHNVLGFFVLVLSLHSKTIHSWKRHHYRWWAAKLNLCSILTPIEQWGVFGVPQTSTQDNSLFGNPGGPVALLSVAECIA